MSRDPEFRAALHGVESTSRVNQFIDQVVSGSGVAVVYQPMFAFDGTCAAVEALARMASEGDWMTGEALIPECRRRGLLPTLGRHVHRSALRDFSMHASLGFAPPRLALNVSAEEFIQPGFDDAIAELVEEAGVAMDSVVLELTEDAPLPHTPAALQCLRRVRDLGMGLSIDDFGSGSNGFMALRSLLPTQIKLDRSLLTDLVEGDILLDGIIRTAHAMGVEVVAEGVETKEQAQILTNLDCDLLQGYYLGMPGVAPSACARIPVG